MNRAFFSNLHSLIRSTLLLLSGFQVVPCLLWLASRLGMCMWQWAPHSPCTHWALSPCVPLRSNFASTGTLDFFELRLLLLSVQVRRLLTRLPRSLWFRKLYRISMLCRCHCASNVHSFGPAGVDRHLLLSSQFTSAAVASGTRV